MTLRDKLEQAQAVLVLGSDDETGTIFADPVWLGAGETGEESVDQVSKHRESYTGGGLILTASELRS